MRNGQSESRKISQENSKALYPFFLALSRLPLLYYHSVHFRLTAFAFKIKRVLRIWSTVVVEQKKQKYDYTIFFWEVHVGPYTVGLFLFMPVSS